MCSLKLTESFCSLYKLTDHERLAYYDCRQLWPSVTRDDILAYFINSPDVDKEAMKSFKSLEAYYYVKAGKVHSITAAVPKPGITVLKGIVSPSQRSNEEYSCWVAAEKKGRILDAICSCTAGLGRCCSHTAAVCYVLHFWYESVRTATKGGLSVTDVPCPWVMPRLKQVEPKPARNLRYERHRPTKDIVTGNEGHTADEQSSEVDFEAFVAKLKQVAPGARYFTLVEINEKQKQQQCETNHQMEPPEFYITVEQPLCSLTLSEIRKRGFIGENIKDMCDFAMGHLRVSQESAAMIEVLTRGQSSSPLWFRHRRGRITASVMKDVCASRMKKTECLTRKILVPTTINSPAVKYGLQNENAAKQRLMDVLQPSHINARLSPCGLMISPTFPFLGCSPDGLFECDCHPPMLVEVKCLYSLKDVHPANLVQEGQKRNICLSPEGALKTSHRYYYQIQMQLHLNPYGVEGCYLFLHVEQGGMLVTVRKDSQFWDRNIDKITTFFKDVILPRMLLDD